MEEMKNTLNAIGAAFEQYKKTNDERLEAIAKGANVGELTTKLNAIEADLKKLNEEKGALEARMNRPANLDGKTAEQVEYAKEFDAWARKGVEGGLSARAVNITTGADGGFAVPDEVNMSVYDLMLNANPMRQVCNVVTVSTPNYSQLVGVHGATGGWVGEADARGATNSPQLAKATAVMGELYANPQASQQSLDDIAFDVEGWLAREIAGEFAAMENVAFTSGNGTNKPKGIFAYSTAATKDGTRAYGTIQHVATGVAGDFSATPGDDLINLTAALKSGHLMGAKFMMNRATLARVRKFKDKDDNYLWQPGLQLGVADTLLGYEVVVNDDMDDIGANKLAIAFGDFKAAYTIVDRKGIRILRDPYSNKPYVGFYATKRVGGMLVDSEAVKVLKFSV